MRFFIDFDNGPTIRGWIVPDNPLAISRVAVAVDGRRVAEIPASITDETFRRSGWHSTGQCTFEVTEILVPGLSEMPRIELYDADTNVLVYRRVPRDGLAMRRVLLLNAGIHPETAIQGTLFRHFQQSYFGLHRMSDEIITSILGSQAMPSSFLSGALVIPRYESYLTPDLMLTAILLHDPHVEMANRMLWLKERAQTLADPARAWRAGRFGEAALFAQNYDYTDPKSLKHFFRMMPETVYHLLYNPLTRLLGTRLPDDRVNPGNSIVAIEILARIGIVGHRDYFAAFCSTLFDQAGIDEAVPAPSPIAPEALALAERLRKIKAVEPMLVFDIAMADAVISSVAKSWAN